MIRMIRALISVAALVCALACAAIHCAIADDTPVEVPTQDNQHKVIESVLNETGEAAAQNSVGINNDISDFSDSNIAVDTADTGEDKAQESGSEDLPEDTQGLPEGYDDWEAYKAYLTGGYDDSPPPAMGASAGPAPKAMSMAKTNSYTVYTSGYFGEGSVDPKISPQANPFIDSYGSPTDYGSPGPPSPPIDEAPPHSLIDINPTPTFNEIDLPDPPRALEVLPLTPPRDMPEWILPVIVWGKGPVGDYDVRPLFDKMTDKCAKLKKAITDYEIRNGIEPGDMKYCIVVLRTALSGIDMSADYYGNMPIMKVDSDAVVNKFLADARAAQSRSSREAPIGGERFLAERQTGEERERDYEIFVNGVFDEWQDAKEAFYERLIEFARKDPGAVAKEDNGQIEAMILLEAAQQRDKEKDKDKDEKENKNKKR
jgi:hypothetical protein